ncbi:hypothetical protein Tco_1067843 [Tanacetum coccineum]|uniref:Uncharacterized protein n=1 Tax=Tanacetum coccineum TaxID=301880 RepID=A0ABQ5HFH0_9ASTR
MQEKLKFSKSQGASTPAEIQCMQNIPYALVVGLIMYVVRCTRPDVAVSTQKHIKFLALTMYFHVLDKKVIGQYVDQIEPLKVHGYEPVYCEDVPDPMLDQTKPQFDKYVRMGIDFTSLSDGIILNTWRDMDYASLDALKYNHDLRSVVKVSVYDIGPLSREVDPASS